MAVNLEGLSRPARAVTALSASAWAYMAALRRGHLVAAPTILAAFQQAYTNNRGLLVQEATRGGNSEANSVFPRALRITGQYDQATRTAIALTLATLNRSLRSLLASLPTHASELGAWWSSNLESRFPPSMATQNGAVNAMWDAVRVTDGHGIDAGQRMGTWIVSTIEAVPSPPVMAPISTESITNIVEDLAGRATPPVEPGGAFLVTGRAPSPGAPDWMYLVGGLGVVTLGGMLAWNIYRRARG